MSEPHREIERKFLLSAPPAEDNPVFAGAQRIEIEQVYLVKNGSGSRRVRKAVKNGLVFYYLTEKTRISDLVREEREREITASEYLAYLAEADPDRAPLSKTRWAFQHDGLVWELDDFHLAEELWILEVELPAEDTPADPPAFLELAGELTYDRRFTSKALARRSLDAVALAALLAEYDVRAARTA